MYQFKIETLKEIVLEYLADVNRIATQIEQETTNTDLYIAYDKAMNLLVSSLYEYNLKAPIMLQYKAIGDKEIGSSSEWWGDNLWNVFKYNIEDVTK